MQSDALADPRLQGCYWLGNPGGAAGGAPPYTDDGCAGGSTDHCYESTCCSVPPSHQDPPGCAVCHGAFVTLSATKFGVELSRGEVYGLQIINSFFDWVQQLS